MAAAASTPTAQQTDTELIERVCAGDRAAFDGLYDRYFPRVFGFVNRRMRNRADTEETVQEVFINIFSSLASFRGESSFAAWALGVARRTVAGRFKKKRHITVPLEDPDLGETGEPLNRARSREASPLEHYECTERVARMEAAARETLSGDQWRLFELHHLEHHSVREIARVLDRSEDSIKSNLYRARKLLMAR